MLSPTVFPNLQPYAKLTGFTFFVLCKHVSGDNLLTFFCARIWESPLPKMSWTEGVAALFICMQWPEQSDGYDVEPL